MPRRRLCQHPTLHTVSSYVATGSRPVSSRLLNFIRTRYDLEQLNIRWLALEVSMGGNKGDERTG